MVKVHTNEEAQVFVHDLNPFVTVQLLEETPAVLSFGKLCEDHGYSYEWVSGQMTRLTKNGKNNICKTDNFVPLVVPRFSADSESSSFSTSQSQESSSEDAHLVSENKAASSSSSGSVSEQSDEQATKRLGQDFLQTHNQQKKRDDKKNSDEPLADIPDWLTEFKDNLVEELHAPAHSSPGTDLELPVEVAIKSRKHNIFTHFPKERNCEVCLRTKITRAPCRTRTGEAIPRVEKFGDLITADHKVLNEGRESRDNHRYAVVVQALATQWIQSYPSKTKTSQETEKSLRKFLESSKKPKLIFTDNSLEFRNSCEIYHGITALQHLIDPRHMTSLKEPFDEKKEGTSAVLLQSGLDEKWWTPWNAIAICETSQTSWPTRKLRMKIDLENHSKVQSYLLEQWSHIIQTHQKISQEFINLARKYHQLSFLAMS